MKKLLLVSLCFLMFFVTQVSAQNRTVTGTVTAKDDGLPMPGVSVKVKGSTIGTQTNTAGKYTISVPTGAVLVFSFIGYETLSVPVKGDVVNVMLTVSSKELGEVVVTGALGIKKQEKEVGYATTNISGSNANETSVINPINGLTGKVAGLVIQQTNDGIDPTIKVNLRGNRSLLGNNSALFVLDGVPVTGAIIAALNPNDIQDYNVLNGSGAAALYGSEASNGAIIVTTKRGSADGKPVITYTNSLQFQQVAVLPKIQTMYGQYGGEGVNAVDNYLNPITGFPEHVPFENELWGPAFNGQTVTEGLPVGSANGPLLTVPYSYTGENPIKAFFQTGITEQNDVSVAQGDAKNSFNFDLQDSHQTGITPEDANERISTRLGITRTFGILRADLSTNYTRSTVSTNGGTDWQSNNNLYANIMQFPANLNINSPYFKDVNNPEAFGYAANYFSGYSTNPWWTIEDNRTNITRNTFSGNLNLTLSPTKWFDASYRVSDYFGTFDSKNTVDAVAPFSPYLLNNPVAGGNFFAQLSFPNGVKGQTTDISGFGDGTGSIVNTTGVVPNFNGGQGFARLQGDALLNFHKTFFDNWKTNLLLGNTIWEEDMNYTYDKTPNLLIPGFYNQNAEGGSPTLYTAFGTIRQIAYFADLNISYKGWANLEATLRNDQDSRLALANNSFFYPSVKGSFIPTDAFPILKNNVLNYAKFYADLSRVGQVSLPPYEINPTFVTTSGFPFGSLSGFGTSGVNYPSGLKPEQISEFEIGTELGLFNDRLDVKADYYNQISRNQTLSVSTSPATGYNQSVINAGEVQSQGYELSAIVNVLQKGADKIGWSVGGNLAINESKVVSLVGQSKQLILQTTGNAAVIAVVGKPFPQLFTTDYYRDPQGHEIVSATTGEGTINPTLIDMGSANPKYNLGVNTNLSYKFITLTIVAEYRGGNVVYNGLGSTMTFAGSDEFSSQAGRQIFIQPNSVINTGTSANPVYVKNTTVPVQTGGINYWVEQPGAPQAVGSTYVSSADFWKIREVALDFNLNRYVKNLKVIKGLSIGLNARNLFTFLPKGEMWGDPELSNAPAASTSSTSTNGVGATTTNQLPSSRYFGGKLQVTF